MRLALLGAIAAAALAVPVANAAGNSIVLGSPSPTVASGVFFKVTTSGNRDFDEIGVVCDNGYSTRITVALDTRGAGTSGIVHPPAGSCTATLEIPKSIGRVHVLASVDFTVAP